MIALEGMATGVQVSDPATEQYEMQKAPFAAEGSVGQGLAAMDAAVTAGAVRIGPLGLNGVEQWGPRGYGRFPWAVDTITVNETGVIEAVEPGNFKSVIGVNLSDQKHLQRLYSQKVPVMSDVFLSAEGIPAVDIASPVFSPDGKFIGATTLLFNPEPFFIQNTPEKSDGTPWHLMVMQKDGLIVYEPDTGQIGKNALPILFQAVP